MLLHIRPSFFSKSFAARLLFLLVQPWGLCLYDGKEITTRKPYRNTHYFVACRKKGQKAIDGLLIETPEQVRSFWTIAHWLANGADVVTHRVNYEIIDDDFPAASDDSLLWHATGEESGNWTQRIPAHMTAPAMAYRPCATLRKEDFLSLENVRDEVLNESIIVERIQNLQMPTIERERLLDNALQEGRGPQEGDAFLIKPIIEATKKAHTSMDDVPF